MNRNVSPSWVTNIRMTVHAAWTVFTARDFWTQVVPDVLRGRTAPMVVHYNARWVIAPIMAICLGRHVFAWRPVLTQWVLDHEERHTQQYAEYGFFGYLARWFHQSLTVGYVQNRYEQEADAYANAKAEERFAAAEQRFAEAEGRAAGFDGWFGRAVARRYRVLAQTSASQN